MIKLKELISEVVYKFKGFTRDDMDELDAFLYRSGVDGKPDFNKMTYTTNRISKQLEKILQTRFRGKKIKESTYEAKKRDYKAEYKKYGSSKKAKKYRAELNQYNRKKGTYGNGDGKDASHKNGKIVGFEAESKNRGRAEKSRLKKEGKYTVHFDVGSPGLMSKTVNAKNAKDAARQVASGLKGGAKLIRKVEKESINEAPGKNHKDQYYGAARVKVEPYTYKNQKRDFHDVSMYRDHKKPYNYYLSIRLAHSNKVDMVVDTGTHILKKAGKWAQGFIKRRVGGTGKERFS